MDHELIGVGDLKAFNFRGTAVALHGSAPVKAYDLFSGVIRDTPAS